MRILSEAELHEIINFQELIDVLDHAFTQECEIPGRNKHKDNGDRRLIVMPALGYKGYTGIKVLTATPSNSGTELPYLQGFYTLFDQESGLPLVQMDAATLTNYRTAAASALASKYLSNKSSKHLLMIGSGSLAPYLIEAHSTIRPIDKVSIWSRTFGNAQRLASATPGADAVGSIDAVIDGSDIISCATQSNKPLVTGDLLSQGQHIDLVGGYTHAMRESDDATLRRSSVYVDILSALDESGDLTHPLKNGTWRRDLLKGTLGQLCSGDAEGRTRSDEITLFKSVGYALEDIATAAWVWESLN